MQSSRVKYAAWFLLVMLLLDLSTAGICSAGTFPGTNSRSRSTVTSSTQAEAAPVQNLDDDGCFCCCTHVLPGAHFVLNSMAGVTAAEPPVAIANLSTPPQLPFHPPKA